MKAIVNADKNWGIGCGGELLISIPADMRFFREMTTGHVVVMGRKTLESFPGRKPLPNRTNVVMTGNPDYQPKGVTVVHSQDELSRYLSTCDPDDVFVIGGGQIYQMLLPLCDTVYVTRVDHSYHADTWFPDLDQDPAWELKEQSEEQTCHDIIYHFCTYKRVGGDPA